MSEEEKNALAVPDVGNLDLVSPDLTEEQIDDVAASTDYFKRLQLMGSNSEAVKEGKMAMGHYALVTDKENMKDLGNQVDVLVCGMRLKAMEITDEGDVINSYDPNEPDFVRIKELSGNPDSGCLCGLDFLLWLPSEQMFVTFFMASKSARREAPNLRAKIQDNKPGAATLNVKLASNKRYKWHVTVVKDCSTPFAMPEGQDIVDNVTKFQNPPKTESEAVTEDSPERER